MRSLVLGLCGLLLTAVNATAATTYQYDDLGRLSIVSYDNSKQITYGYDPAGNRASVQTADSSRHSQIAPKKHKAKHAHRSNQA
ncbi:MAG: RHS repeat domain-containing protein [Rhizomicrobium sp.]